MGGEEAGAPVSCCRSVQSSEATFSSCVCCAARFSALAKAGRGGEAAPICSLGVEGEKSGVLRVCVRVAVCTRGRGGQKRGGHRARGRCFHLPLCCHPTR